MNTSTITDLLMIIIFILFVFFRSKKNKQKSINNQPAKSEINNVCVYVCALISDRTAKMAAHDFFCFVCFFSSFLSFFSYYFFQSFFSPQKYSFSYRTERNGTRKEKKIFFAYGHFFVFTIMFGFCCCCCCCPSIIIIIIIILSHAFCHVWLLLLRWIFFSLPSHRLLLLDQIVSFWKTKFSTYLVPNIVFVFFLYYVGRFY